MTTIYEEELRMEIHALGVQMVRMETQARAAADRSRWKQVAECEEQRDLARERRSRLMYELWESRRA